MTAKTITRVDLYAAVYKRAKVSRSEATALVESFFNQITDSLARGEVVKLASFGTFTVRKKNERIGRNPRTGEHVPISPRRVIVFKASPILKQEVNGGRSGANAGPAGSHSISPVH